ncbi:MAG: hypothetical protein R2874_03710 [Desulfobacterales bacterium]
MPYAGGGSEAQKIQKSNIKKIISGATQTGAVPAPFGCRPSGDIPHGGWVPKGKKG